MRVTACPPVTIACLLAAAGLPRVASLKQAETSVIDGGYRQLTRIFERPRPKFAGATAMKRCAVRREEGRKS